jgi:hypothetical protein
VEATARVRKSTCGLIAVLNCVNLGQPSFAVTHFQLSGRLGNNLAAFHNRQLTGFLVEYRFICATLNSVSLTLVSTVKVTFVFLLFANAATLVMVTSNRATTIRLTTDFI